MGLAKHCQFEVVLQINNMSYIAMLTRTVAVYVEGLSRYYPVITITEPNNQGEDHISEDVLQRLCLLSSRDP